MLVVYLEINNLTMKSGKTIYVHGSSTIFAEICPTTSIWFMGNRASDAALAKEDT